MATPTPNLQIGRVADDQTSIKIPRINEGMVDLDNAIAGMLTRSVAGASNVTLTRLEALNAVLKFTGVLTGNIVVFLPVLLGTRRDYTVWNATTGAFTLTVKTTTGGSAGVAVTQGTKSLLAHDGTDVFAVVSGGGGGSGDVTAAANFGTDNVLIRSDGTGKGVQLSAVTVTDTTGNISTPGTVTTGSAGGVSANIGLSGSSSGTANLAAPAAAGTGTFNLPVTAGGTFSLGYLNIPQNSRSAAYTLVLEDAGKSIDHPSTDANARTFTIPANSSVAFPVGTALSFSNMTSQVVSIAITTDTMYLAGVGTTGTRSLAQYGTAVARKLTSTTWLISGVGLS
jgi:hypothetical protein